MRASVEKYLLCKSCGNAETPAWLCEEHQTEVLCQDCWEMLVEAILNKPDEVTIIEEVPS